MSICSYLGFFYFDPRFFLIIGPFMLLAMWASMKVKGTFAKYNQGRLRSGVSGLEAAQMILQAAGLHEVRIGQVPGMLSDHYNPVKKTVNLSSEILNGRTPAAVAVAAHECGHAIQHARAYKPLAWRSELVPVVSLTSTLAFPMILGGLLIAGFQWLAWLGIIAFSVAADLDDQPRVVPCLLSNAVEIRPDVVEHREVVPSEFPGDSVAGRLTGQFK